MESRLQDGFEVGEWVVEPQTNLISCDGEQVTIQPQAMQVLVHLAERAGEVVSNDELIEAVWGGRPMSDQPVYKSIQKLRESLGDDLHEPRFIITIPRKGYRLIAPVRPLTRGWRKATEPLTAGSRRGWPLSVKLAVALIAAIVVIMYPWSGRDVEQRLDSVGILPLVDVSRGDIPAPLVDGIYEDLVISAAQIQGLKVISPTTMRHFRGQSADISAIAAAIGVSAIAEGAVQRVDEGLRINVKLVDAQSKVVRWAERYDLSEQDSRLTAVSDLIVRDMARALGFVARGAPASARAVSLDAYQAYVSGRRLIEMRGSDSLLAAVDNLERAIQLDADYALAHATLARAYVLAGRQGLRERTQVQQKAEHHIGRALALQPEVAEAHIARAEFHVDFGDLEEAARALRHAIELSPSHPLAHATLGRVLRRQGRLQESYRARLSAHEIDPFDAASLLDLGHSQMALGSYEEGMGSFRRALTLAPDQLFSLRAMSFWAAEYGHLDEALRLAQEYVLEAPRDNNAMLSLAHAYLALGDVERARQWIERISKPDDAWSYRAEHCRTAVHLAAGEAALAAAELRAGLESAQATGNGSLALRQRYALAAKASLFAGDPATAVRLFDLAFAQGTEILAPEDDAHFIGLRAAAYQAVGEESLARAAANRAIRILLKLREAGDARPGLLFELGALEALTGHNEAALEYMEAATSGGWRLHYLSRGDPRLAGLGTEPAFAARIADLDSSVSAMRQNEIDPEGFEADYQLALASAFR